MYGMCLWFPIQLNVFRVRYCNSNSESPAADKSIVQLYGIHLNIDPRL